MSDDAKKAADRLEQALADNAKRKAAAAALHAEQAPEHARLAALWAQADALPSHERQQVLDAAGVRRTSNTPPPPSRIVSGGLGGNVSMPRTQPIRWPAWLALPNVELWQAVALSLSVNPANELRDSVTRAPSRYSRLPAEYFERLSYCKKALSLGGPIKPQGGLYRGMLQSPNCKVLIADVAAFLTLAGYEVPEEIRPRLQTESAPDRGPILKREALVSKHERAWPTIERDLKDASENGLSAAAKAESHGMWWECDALAWATAKGKTRETGPRTPASPFSGLGGE